MINATPLIVVTGYSPFTASKYHPDCLGLNIFIIQITPINTLQLGRDIFISPGHAIRHRDKSMFDAKPGGARADRLLYQAKLALDDTLRLKVVRKMYAMRFGEEPPARRSVEQLRGIEGARVRETYKLLAKKYGVEWKARNYDTSEWNKGDLPIESSFPGFSHGFSGHF